jgi:uncharacterized coiled-coil protein SlyX
MRANTFGSILGCVTAILLPLSVDAAPLDSTVQELQRRVAEQAAIIRGLQRELDALVKQVDGSIRPDGPTPAPAAPEGSAQTQAEAETPPAAPAAPEGSAQTQAEAETPPAAPSAPAPVSRPSAPGQVTATEEEAERALERTLTAEGALLLPYGQVEVEPSFSYTRRHDDVSALARLNGVTVPVNQKVRDNEFQPSVFARAGLPFDAQLEANMPYEIIEQERVTDVGGVARVARSATGSGIGDFSVGLAKTVLREKNWWPDLIARVTWNTPTGQAQDNRVTLGGGFNQIVGQVVALKRQDPLAFVASASYQKTLNQVRGIEPGNEAEFFLGTFLATSPNTSLQISLDQTFADDAKFKGDKIKDSDQVSSTLNLGISSILARNVLLQLVGGVGLTPDAPDYSVTVSLPIRFDVPAPRLNQ